MQAGREGGGCRRGGSGGIGAGGRGAVRKEGGVRINPSWNVLVSSEIIFSEKFMRLKLTYFT